MSRQQANSHVVIYPLTISILVKTSKGYPVRKTRPNPQASLTFFPGSSTYQPPKILVFFSAFL